MIYKGQEISIEEKLRSLYDLQLIDSLVDEIRTIIDSIPLQITAIENEIENILKKSKELREEIKEYDIAIQQEKNFIKKNEIFIKKYTLKQNNLELDKEIEFKELEIELCHRKWKKLKYKKDKKSIFYINYIAFFKTKKDYLSNKIKEFSEILNRQERKKFFLLKKSTFFIKKIDLSLLQKYNHIRSRTKLAIVPINKKAPLGSFFTIPTQKSLDVAQRNNIELDEHSGRILIDPVLAEEESHKIYTFYKFI